MEEEKPRKSLTSSVSRGSLKTKNPFSRVKDEGENRNKTGLSMRKSWSTDSLGLLSQSNRLGKTVCICAPTKHEGSFRCRLHRSSATSHGAATAELHLPKPLLSSRRLGDQ
ncbi:hypothetical protein AtNW77_Chr3g0212691 [Arabidopsis thaliana]|uniref:Serine-rich protein-like protein n=4 Tax=Arabidopsis TaxID=3701 RepID=Q9LXZ0_ARATH|nr:serine-rich protein-like protein [Arabidopsis thaliana]KAG7628739.1 hypothetical protein ISN45_At03g049480 [Arabidopsis thaliana x Arabidopsis arenosa]KAG7634646.1 hypothetical protein ISN44_As03g048300 [Arabidopsis suecica]AEE79528.1 serine-rich protein-like protein [Arabidopsis thaliana]OAP02830.1 hypothetical protein AXX17_AT3G51110 [Arabidopsis thaliana]CAA0386798.1 unnamed protein product [Arabidopsis thaliana]|eukprot:NP_191209.1 serine-rich protein-like protein [Arabidopsis thaliana]